jgi:hypothetical protein
MLLAQLLACAFRPLDGDYAATPSDEVVTDCPDGASFVSTDATTLAVDVDDDGSFTMQDANVDTPYVFRCTLEGKGFSCPADEALVLGSATVDVVADVTGTWTSASAFTYAMDVSWTCSGDGCALLESQGYADCGVNLDGSATRTGD